jgi:hypothetical protein
MVKRNLIWLFIIFSSLLNAQVNELGIWLGGSNLIGDVGASLFINPKSAASGFLYKYNKNPRIAYRLGLTNLSVDLNDADAQNEIQQSFQVAVQKTITELSAGIEFNFFEYNLANGKQHQTPYLFLGLAALQYKVAKSTSVLVSPKNSVNYENERSLAIPFGIGYKRQLFRNIAFAVETRWQYAFKDNIDDGDFIAENLIPDTFSEKAKFNNNTTNDWYTFTGISLVYTFGRPACYTTSKR